MKRTHSINVICTQADQLLTEQANERDHKRLEKATTDRQQVVFRVSYS